MSIKSDVVHQQGSIVAASGTAVFWVLLLLIGIFLPTIPKKPVYKEIKITLSSAHAPTSAAAAAAPVAKAPAVSEKPEAPAPAATQAVPVTKSAPEETAAKAPAPQIKKEVAKVQKAPEPVKKAEPKPVVKAETKPATQPKSASQTTPVASAKSRPLAKSVDDLMAEAETSTEKKSAVWDDSLFASDTASKNVSKSAPTKTETVTQILSEDALKGSDSQVVAQSSGAETTSNTAAVNKKGSGTASAATAAALGNIESATYTYTTGNGVSSSAKIAASKGTSGFAMQMSDGSARVLLDPAKPQIKISDENAALIDASKTVTITFTVLPEGTVPLSRIQVTPSAALPPPVQLEIHAQIASWRFETADYQSTAHFEYTIVKR